MKKVKIGIALILISIAGIGQGVILSDSSYALLPVKHRGNALNTKVLASKVDLSMYTPAPLNQQDYGTCVGVSVGYYMRTILEAIRQNVTDPYKIDSMSYSPSYLYNAIKDTKDTECYDGTFVEKALNYLKTNPIPKYIEQNYPNCTNNNKVKLDESSTILDYNILFGLTDRQESIEYSIKKALSERTPVVVTLELTDNFYNLGFWETLWNRMLNWLGIGNSLALWQPSKSKTKIGGHAVCVVGYDDSKYGGAFHAINSFGDAYGDFGFFWIKYTDMVNHVKYAYQPIISPIDNGQNIELDAEIILGTPSDSTGKTLPFKANFLETNNNDIDNKNNNLASYSLVYPQPTGMNFIFTAKLKQGSYLYLLGMSNNKVFDDQILFPHNELTSAYIGPNTLAYLPGPKLDSTYVLLPPAGEENWLFLFSPKPLNIKTYTSELNNAKGNIQERVQKVFGNDLVPMAMINYKPKKVGFTLKNGHKGGIVPVLINLSHSEFETF